MDELQKARADWLSAMEENLRLSAENSRLKRENHDLRMKLATAQCQATVMEGLATAYGRALLTVG